MKDIRDKLREEGFKMEVLSFNGEWMIQLYTKKHNRLKVTSLIDKYSNEVVAQEVEEIE